MKRVCFLILSVVLFGQLYAQQTNVSGTINADSTWTAAKSPYVVIGNLTIAATKTLTVDSGVVVRFQNNTGLYVYGNLHVRHTKFTSDKDTVGGTPQKGDWNFIQLGDGGAQWGTSTIDTCIIRYGGASSPDADAANLYVASGNVSVNGCDISFSKNAGIMVGNGATATSASLANTNIFSSDWPVCYRYTASVTLTGTNNMSGNTHNAIRMRYNEHNGNSSMTLPTAPVPYVFEGNFNIRSAAGMAVSPSNILKFRQGQYLNVEGVLSATASAPQDILFTAYTDDNAGGDSNNDATATTPASSYWGGIVFYDSSKDSLCTLRRVKVRFAGYNRYGGISMFNASPTVDSCDMANNFYGAVMQYVSNPVFSNNTIGSSELVPIALSFAATPVFTNNQFSFSDNRDDAIGLLGGNLPADAVLPIRSVTSIPNVTYLMLEDVVIPPTRTLTINKGVVIKASYDNGYINVAPRIIVQGTLTANGTPDSMIVFTSTKDDNFGNPFDTNRDGTSSFPDKGNWGGIIFEGVNDTVSSLNYCRIKYASMPSVYYNTRWISGGAITTVNTSPFITNCVIENAVFGIYAFQSSKPRIWNDTIRNTQYTPIALSVSADPSFIGNAFVNTAWKALGIIGEELGLNGAIKQRTVAGITNITYVLLEDLTVNSGTNVIVDPGVVVKANHSGIFVNGGFKAVGTASAPVVFTSIADDNYGNPQDSNGDGSATTPARGDWTTIRFQGTSDDVFCVLDSCVVKFGGTGGSDTWGGVSFADASGKLANTMISDAYQYGISCDGNSVPHVTNVEIRNSRLDPIAMSLKADPFLTNITFTANRSKGIKILEGTLSSNALLKKRDVAGINNIAYIVDYLTINQNATLTIEPGVVIKFPAGYYQRSITVDGGLVANGTSSQRIVFTSLNDDSNGGDTNGDGNTSSPSRTDWFCIAFTDLSNDGVNVLRNCDIRYGGAPPYYDASLKSWGMVRVLSSHVVIDSCSIQQAYTSGVGIYGSADPSITNCQIANINETPITMSMFSNPSFANNLSLNVGYLALGIVPEVYAVDGTVPVRNFGGYSNITYVLYSDLGNGTVQTVNSGTKITIPAGVVFKGGQGIFVNGSLIVNGTNANPVVFTDTRDDSYGNPFDTNGDGTATSPQFMDNYANINFNDVSDDSTSVVRYTVLRYKEWGVNLQQAAPTINHCTFDRTRWGVRLNGVSTPALDSCTFQNLDFAPMLTSIVSYPRSSSANSITGKTYRALGLVNETLAQDVTLFKRNFGGITNIPYLLSNYTVGSGAVLTIEPGVVMKFREDARLVVRKGLIAEGGAGADSSIVFTDYRDDFYGGDTNADSTASAPSNVAGGWYPGNWRGLDFEDESLDPLCRLKHVVVRYSGAWYVGDEGGITTVSASPSVLYARISENRIGIIAKASSNPLVNYSDLTNNAEYGIKNLNSAFNIDARWNWWGSNNGPTHSTNVGGTGDKITDFVQYSPYLNVGASNPIAGDVSLNGLVQAFDASLVLKFVVNPHGADSLNGLQKQVADVSKNGGPDTVAVTAYDASLILQYVVGKLGTFPLELGRAFPMDEQTKRALALQKSARAVMVFDPVQARRGERITVPIRVEQVANATAFQMNLNFDPSVLTAVSFKPSGIASDFAYGFSKSNGSIGIALAGSSVLNGSGIVGEMTFDVSNDVRGNVASPVSVSRLLVNEQEMTSGARGLDISVEGKPTTFSLAQNYPNPFNPTTTIAFQVPDDRAQVEIVIYNLLGQAVKRLVNGTYDAGTHSAVWDGRNDGGTQVVSGFYIYRMRSGNTVQTKKLTFLK